MKKTSRKGFIIIELVIVFVVIAMLPAVLTPAFAESWREQIIPPQFRKREMLIPNITWMPTKPMRLKAGARIWTSKQDIADNAGDDRFVAFVDSQLVKRCLRAERKHWVSMAEQTLLQKVAKP